MGASPLASAYFHDEPSIEVANSIGFDVATLGNHEFDEGVDELSGCWTAVGATDPGRSSATPRAGS